MERSEKLTKKYLNWLTYEITGAAIDVHRHFGPGLLESVYEKALIYELQLRGYDILVEELIVVENKSVIEMHPIFEAILISYMKHLEKPKGILFNFNVRNLYYEGRRTFVNEYYSALPDE